MSTHPLTAKTLAFFLLIVASAGLGRAAEITLAPRAQTKSAIIRLGDVARIVGPQDEVEQLKQLELAVSPSRNGVRELTLREIRERLTLRGIDPLRHRLVGAPRVSVRNTSPPPRPVPTYMAGTQAGVVLASAKSAAEAEEKPLVVVATRMLRIGDLIGRGDIRMEPAKSKRLPYGAFQDLDSVYGMEVKSTIAAGRSLGERDLQRPILVRRNEEARLVVRAGRVTVATGVKALSNGALNDFITVEELGSKRKLSARVTGYRQMEIDASRVTQPVRVASGPQFSLRDRYTRDRVARANTPAAPTRHATLRPVSFPGSQK